MKQCKQCGKDIPDHRIFCSQSCSTTFRNLSKGRHPVKKLCEWCGKEFIVKYHLRDTAKFCSDECRIADLQKNNGTAPCSYCGKPVTINWYKKNVKTPFCSKDCFSKSRALLKSEVICAGCGKPFMAHKSRQEYYNRLFCSRECYALHGNLPSTPGYIANEKYEQIRWRLVHHALYLRWRSSVLERDDYKCIQCSSGENLRVHHVVELYHIVYKYNHSLSVDTIDDILNAPEFSDVSNGITLCHSCHLKEHRRPSAE